MYHPSALQEMPNSLATCLESYARLQSAREDHHIDRDTPLLSDEGILHLDDQLALFAGLAGSIGDLRDLAADEDRPFLQQPLVELIIGFISRAHVDVEIRDLRPGALLYEVGELQALHAADA